MTDTSATGEQSPPVASQRSWAVVTGASSGIGRELARQFAEHDFNLLISSEDAELDATAEEMAKLGVEVLAVPADLRRYEDVETLADAVHTVSPIGALALNAGIGVSGPFATGPDLRAELDVVQLNVTSQVHLARRVLPLMVAQQTGRVLITSSIAATQPGPYEAVYAASKAFLFSFAEALRTELSDSGVTVTALMPGPTDTEFFERAELTDTKLGAGPKDDPAEVAKQGFEALMKGKDHIVAGSLKNRMMTAAAKVMPQKVTAAAHQKLSEPGSAEPDSGQSSS